MNILFSQSGEHSRLANSLIWFNDFINYSASFCENYCFLFGEIYFSKFLNNKKIFNLKVPLFEKKFLETFNRELNLNNLHEILQPIGLNKSELGEFKIKGDILFARGGEV